MSASAAVMEDGGLTVTEPAGFLSLHDHLTGPPIPAILS